MGSRGGIGDLEGGTRDFREPGQLRMLGLR